MLDICHVAPLSSNGKPHPELVDASNHFSSFDRILLLETNGEPFLRRPYRNESEMLAVDPRSPRAQDIAGIAVFPCGDSNIARIPIYPDEIQLSLQSGQVRDLWTHSPTN